MGGHLTTLTTELVNWLYSSLVTIPHRGFLTWVRPFIIFIPCNFPEDPK